MVRPDACPVLLVQRSLYLELQTVLYVQWGSHNLLQVCLDVTLVQLVDFPALLEVHHVHRAPLVGSVLFR